jgi:hypothetical protein
MYLQDAAQDSSKDVLQDAAQDSSKDVLQDAAQDSSKDAFGKYFVSVASFEKSYEVSFNKTIYSSLI